MTKLCVPLFALQPLIRWASVFSLCVATACAARSPNAAVPSEAEGAAPGSDAAAPPGIYLEAALLEVPSEKLGSLPTKSLSELSARTDGSVLSAPHVLLAPNRRVELFFGKAIGTHDESGATDGAAATWSWTVESAVLDSGLVRVRFEIFDASAPDSEERVETTVELVDRQVVFAPTELRAAAGKVIVLVAQPHIVRDRDDMRRILERKRNQPA